MPSHPMTLSSRLSGALIALVVSATVIAFPSAPAQAATPRDGSTAERAAASCWEVKQVDPSAADGAYWLLTPQLGTPTRFHCDQTTDGGGWVLVARGRQAWTESGDGQGTAAEVASPTGSMRAKQLPGSTIDALLNGGRVDALADGVRLRRATDTAGTTWQEVRFSLARRDRWSWALSAGPDAGIPVSSYSVDGVTSTAAQQTRDLRLSSDTQRTWTYASGSNAYVRGFSYGQGGPTGTTAAGSYLYSQVAGGQYATPYTQMYLRPKLTTTSLAFPAIGDGGTGATAAVPVPESFALPNPWGVTGLGRGGSLYYATEVSAFAQIGNRVYVGGNFTHVRRADGSKTVKQSYLAAFDARTGAWISSFRPRLNNQVKALAPLPNGTLAVGGQFTTLGGKKARGLVVVDSRGTRVKKFTAEIKQTTRGAKQWVRTLDVRGSYLYVGGGFTRYRGGSGRTLSAYSNILRVKASTGAPDKRWRPNLGAGIVQANGKRTISSSVLSLEVSDDGRTVYAAGQFQKGYVGDDGRRTVSRPGVAAIRTTRKATFRSWPVRYSTSNRLYRYQQAVESVGKAVWLGGSQHSLFSYVASTLKLRTADLTLSGGDVQSIDERGGVVYASCHCDDWNYSGTTHFDVPRASGYAQVDRIGRVGAWNAATGAFYPQFAPSTTSRASEGPWAVMSAADGTLWAGGDYLAGVGADGALRWTGGFIRYPMRAHTPPTAPSGLSVSLSGATAQLGWRPSSTGGVSYEVIRNDRVVAVTGPGATSVAVPDSAAGDRWFVRASDGSGNRSASTPVAR
ncbi:MAG: fibrinogen-like YCDxxxxGGGW domain-containing protein [Aeromicrobium sp.]